MAARDQLCGRRLRAGRCDLKRVACAVVHRAFLQNFEKRVPGGSAAARALRSPGTGFGDGPDDRLAGGATHLSADRQATLGRACPDWPCDGVFETEAWPAAYTVTKKAPPPKTPPSLAERVRLVAGFGGFLNRKHAGFPGSKTLWIGLQRVQDFALALAAQHASQRRRTEDMCNGMHLRWGKVGCPIRTGVGKAG